MTRVLVLGGTGFVGPFVVRQLVDAGHEVTLFHRGTREPALTEGAAHVHADYAHLPEHLPRLAGWKPEIVVDVNPGVAKNGHGVLNFAGVARRGVVLTSMDVYRAMSVLWGSGEPAQEMPVDEDSEVRNAPSPDLGAELAFDNLEVERAVAAHAAELPCTVLRCPVIYGPLDTQRRLRDYVHRMDAGESIELDARVARLRLSRGYVENVAAAVLSVVADERSAARTYNVGEADALTELEWIGAVGRACGWNGEVVLHGAAEPPLQDLYADTSRIRRELGYAEPVDRDEGLRRAVEWERAAPT